jgi:hypothetical protein
MADEDKPQKFEQVPKPVGLQINREQALLLIRGLKTLPESDQTSIVFRSLIRDLETLNTVWERIIKNQKLANQQRRTDTIAKKGQMSINIGHRGANPK